MHRANNDYTNADLLTSLTFFAVKVGGSIVYNQYKNFLKQRQISVLSEYFRNLDPHLIESYFQSNLSPLINNEDENFPLTVKKMNTACHSAYQIIDQSGFQPVDVAMLRIIENNASIECCQILTQAGLGHYLSKSYDLIPFTYENKRKGVVWNYIEISEYYKESNLLDLAKKFEYRLEQKQELALILLLNLIKMLIAFKKSGIYFPDIKPSNLFILNEDIVISDKKSFIPVAEDERSNYRKPLIFTPAYLPPEAMYDHRKSSIINYNLNKIETYQVGLTLYEFLTLHMISEKNRNNHEEHFFNFDHPVFQGKTGTTLKYIIEDLVELNVEKRLTIEAVIEKWQIKKIIESKYINASHHELNKEYNINLSQANKARLNASLLLSNLKDNYFQNEYGEVINKTTMQVEHDQFGGIVNEIRKSIHLHHDFKNKLVKLAKEYQKLSRQDQYAYWEHYMPAEECTQAADNFKFLCDLFFQDHFNEILFSDLFQAFHHKNGRKLLADTVYFYQRNMTKFNVVDGKKIQINFEVDPSLTNEYSAKLAIDFPGDAQMPMHDFNQMIIDNLQLGNPQAFSKFELQYPKTWSVGIADTMSTAQKHDYYVMDSAITLLHEIGHLHALLSGQYISNKMSILPSNLIYYHVIEEYLNIEQRPYAESKMDPLFIRIGHTGLECDNVDQLTPSMIADYLLPAIVLERKQEMINSYVRAKEAIPTIEIRDPNVARRLF